MKQFVIGEEAVNKLLNYLGQRPYLEVASAVQFLLALPEVAPPAPLNVTGAANVGGSVTIDPRQNGAASD